MSEAWIQLDSAHVLKGLTPHEQKTLENIQGAINVLPDYTGEVAAEFRQAITDSGVNLSSTPSGFLPPGFIGQASALARWRWLISIPQAKAMQTPERKEAAEKAEKLIEDIASGDRPVASPDTTADTARAGTWNSENKILMRTHPVPRPGPQAPNAYANPDAPADNEAE